MIKPILAGHLAPKLSYILPAKAEITALMTPPGSIMIPVKATATSKPFCKYCGKRYIADKMIPKSTMTKIAPKVKLRCLLKQVLQVLIDILHRKSRQ